ncbi:MAG: hypothetical protein AAFZ52_06780 [Bacteroidota bacterium]
MWYRFLLPLLLLGTGCIPTLPKTLRLPPSLTEASGLSIRDSTFYWHNDSGDGPYLYTTDRYGTITAEDTLDAEAIDYEDLTVDEAGRFYLGDFGNNTGQRTELAVYRYDPVKRQTEVIRFTYPGQDGGGRNVPGNYDCEAMVYHNGKLHLFTKDQAFGRGNNVTYHFRVPAAPGTYVAELVDSLRIPRRIVTAAALDSVRGELVLTAYSFKRWAGFWPASAASLITLTDFPEGRFLRGRLQRRNLAWGIPTQFEAVDFFNEKWLYVASEGNKVRKHAVAKRKRRR